MPDNVIEWPEKDHDRRRGIGCRFRHLGAQGRVSRRDRERMDMVDDDTRWKGLFHEDEDERDGES